MVASKKVEALSGKNPPALGQPLPLTVPLSLAGGNIKANSISQSNINEWMYKHLAWLIYQSVECRALMFFGVGKFGPKGGDKLWPGRWSIRWSIRSCKVGYWWSIRSCNKYWWSIRSCNKYWWSIRACKGSQKLPRNPPSLRLASWAIRQGKAKVMQWGVW